MDGRGGVSGGGEPGQVRENSRLNSGIALEKEREMGPDLEYILEVCLLGVDDS